MPPVPPGGSRVPARTVRTLGLLAAALFLAGPAHTQPAPFVLDPTFGEDGRAFVFFDGIGNATPHAFIRLPDGRLLGVGYTREPDFRNSAALARYTADGQPDPTFGPNGDGTVTFGPLARVQCFAATLDAAGRILCAGLTDDPTTGVDAALTRFTPAGLPDPAFGDGGLVRVEGALNVFNGIHLLPDGRLLVFGANLLGGSRFFLWRLLPDGTPDSDFNGGSPREVSSDFCFTELDGITALTPEGGLVVGCRHLSTGDVAAARFDADGNPDSTFGGTGFVATTVPTDAAPTAVALDGEGRLLIASRPAVGEHSGRLLRLLPDGTLDPAFGTGGVADFSVGPGLGAHNTQHIGVQPDGRLLLVGETNIGEAYLVQFTAAGQPDLTFAPGGMQRLTFLDPVGGGTGRKLLAAGYDEAGRLVGLGNLFVASLGSPTFAFVRLVREGAVAAEPGPAGTFTALHAPEPNPAAASVRLAFDLEAPGPVRLVLYDVLGRAVAVLGDGERQAGRHEVVLEGGRLPAGMYIVHLTTEAGFAQSQRVTLVR